MYVKGIDPFSLQVQHFGCYLPYGQSRYGKCKGQHCAKVQKKKVFQSFTKCIFVLKIKKAFKAVDNLDVCNVTGLRSTAALGSHPAVFIHNSPP